MLSVTKDGLYCKKDKLSFFKDFCKKNLNLGGLFILLYRRQLYLGGGWSL